MLQYIKINICLAGMQRSWTSAVGVGVLCDCKK